MWELALILLAAGEPCQSLLSSARQAYEGRRYRDASALFSRAVGRVRRHRARPPRPRPVTIARRRRDGGARHARSRAGPECRQRAGPQGPRRRRSIWRRAIAKPRTRCAPPPPLAPDDAEIAYDLGRIYYQEGRHPQAADAFRRAIALDPRAYKAWDNLGLALEALGDPAQATRHYLKAMEIAQTDHPPYDVVYANYADLLIKQGDYRQAFDAAAEAAQRNPA